MENNPLKRIVILGAGFGGVYVLKRLEKKLRREGNVEITIVNKKNFFLFTPLLHEVATGNLSPDGIVEPIRPMLKTGMSDFFMADIQEIKTKTKEVVTSGGTISYDYLVVSLGSETNFYNTPGASTYARTLKTLECAVELKNDFIRSFEEATKMESEDKIREALTFVIVGGGATGVELAAEMADFLKKTFNKFYPPYITSLVSIKVIQSQEELVPQFPIKVRQRSLVALEEKGIEVFLGRRVVEVFQNKILLDDKTEIKTNKVIWTAGVKPAKVTIDDKTVLNEGGRFIANEFLQLKDNPEVFVLGDGATFVSSKTGKPLPALAQVATKQADTVACNLGNQILGKNLRPFEYNSSGTLISLGEWMALGHVGGVTFGGRFTWWFWRTVYLSKIISKTKRVKVALDWSIDLFFPRDISEL